MHLMPTTGPQIAVIGGATCSDRHLELAIKPGRAWAKAGAILLCGGRGGVMRAAAEGPDRLAARPWDSAGTDHEIASPIPSIQTRSSPDWARREIRSWCSRRRRHRHRRGMGHAYRDRLALKHHDRSSSRELETGATRSCKVSYSSDPTRPRGRSQGSRATRFKEGSQ